MLDKGQDGDQSDPPIVETVPIQDIFATGIEWRFFPEFVRVTFWAEHPMGFGENTLHPVERVVVAKVVMPIAAFERAVLKWNEIEDARTAKRRSKH